jgi:hypothetical protein
VTSGAAAAVPQTKAIAAIVNIVRFNASLHIILSLPRGVRKGHNQMVHK